TAVQTLKDAFGVGAAPAVGSAPGRVTPAGEHVDYVGGRVACLAVDLAAAAAARPPAEGRRRAPGGGRPAAGGGWSGSTPPWRVTSGIVSSPPRSRSAGWGSPCRRSRSGCPPTSPSRLASAH